MGSMVPGTPAPPPGGAPRISGNGTQMGGPGATRPGFTPGGTVGGRSMPNLQPPTRPGSGPMRPGVMPTGLTGPGVMPPGLSAAGGGGISASQYETMKSGAPRISGSPGGGGISVNDWRRMQPGGGGSPGFVGLPVERKPQIGGPLPPYQPPPYIQEPPLPPMKPPGGPDDQPRGGPGGPIQKGTGPNVYSQASNWLDQSTAAMKQAMGYRPQQLGQTNLDPYMNPYTQNVIDTTMQDMNRSRQMAINDNGAAATRAGAFGGSRHGLVEAETNRGFMDTSGQMAAQLRNQGYNTALQGAQYDLGRADAQNALKMQGAGGLASNSGQAFGYGQAIDDNLLQQGMLQRDMQQQIIDAAKGQWGGYTGAADQGLSRLLAMLGGQQYPTKQTTSKQPGIADWLGLLV